jgi:hypothetical protein
MTTPNEGLNLRASDLLGLSGDRSTFTTEDREKIEGIQSNAQVNPEILRSRTSTSTDKVLAAAAMRDHLLSADHDERYVTHSDLDARVRQITVTVPEVDIKDGESMTYALSDPSIVAGSTLLPIVPPGVFTQGIVATCGAVTNGAFELTLFNTEKTKNKGKGSSSNLDQQPWSFIVINDAT